MLKRQKSKVVSADRPEDGTVDALSRVIIPLQRQGSHSTSISLKREQSVVNPINRLGGISSPHSAAPTKTKNGGRESFHDKLNDQQATTDTYKPSHNRIPMLGHNEEFQFNETVDWTRFYVDFEYRMTVIPTKLNLSLYSYGDRGNTLERMTDTSVRSRDGSAILTGESESDHVNETHGIERSSHCVRVNLHRVNPSVTAMLICLNGGPRSFNNITGTFPPFLMHEKTHAVCCSYLSLTVLMVHLLMFE